MFVACWSHCRRDNKCAGGVPVRKGKQPLSMKSYKSAMFNGSRCEFLWRIVSVRPGISGDRRSRTSQAAGR